MIFAATASFYQIMFSFTCDSQFSQSSDFHEIFDGDDTNISLAPNKEDVLYHMIVPKAA